jgi:hypothetical protein
MSKNKLIMALLGAFVTASVMAQTSPLTIEEWTLMQGELKRAEHANKLREELKKGATGPAPILLDKTCDEDLQMSAVYGMGRNLRADFIYRGATVTLSPGGEADMGGWFVKELTPTRALMVKRTKGAKSVKTCPLYLSAGTRDFTAPVVPAIRASEVQVQVPPISPVAAPAPVRSVPASVGSSK